MEPLFARHGLDVELADEHRFASPRNPSWAQRFSRRHHPLETKELELLSGGKTCVVLRLADGSALKILRRWTNADDAVCAELAVNMKTAKALGIKIPNTILVRADKVIE